MVSSVELADAACNVLLVALCHWMGTAEALTNEQAGSLAFEKDRE